MAAKSVLHNNYFHLGAVVLAASLYFYLGYFVDRSDSAPLLCSYGVLFILGLFTYKYSSFSFNQLVALGLFFRLIFLLALPFLSQDFYRFIWDGQLILEGINPYSYTPDMLMQNSRFNSSEMAILHQGMGELSARHYSNYPPLNQLLFALSSWFGQGQLLSSTIAMRLIILVSEIGIAYTGAKILQTLDSNKKHILLWVLNPLVIIELSGNLHFDGVMALGVLCGFYLLLKKRWIWAALAIAASIHIKLIPLVLLPLIWSFLGWTKGLKFTALTIGFVLMGSIPFFNPMLVHHFLDSLSLWFENFEFNSSIFNISQEIGRWISGKNLISQISTVSSIIVFVVTISIALSRQANNMAKLIEMSLWVFVIYFMTATTVHPWYLALPLLLSLFSKYRFMVLWSASVMLSYTAYRQPSVEEIPWVLALEYIPVFGLLVWELKRFQFTSS